MAERHVVTGAAGLIGFALVRELLARGAEVLAMDWGRKGNLEDLYALSEQYPGQLTVWPHDLTSDPFPELGPCDVVFHLAAILGVAYVSQHPYETLTNNLRSTLNVIDWAARGTCRCLVFGSSSETYASGVDAGFVPLPTPEDVVLSVDRIALPRWSYAASKIAGESAVFAAAQTGAFIPLIVRFHNVYGPRMPTTHVIPELLDRARRRVDPFPVFGAEQTRSFLFVDDAAQALLRIGRHGGESLHRVFNVGSPVETRIGDLATEILAVAGHRPQLDLQPAPPGSVRRRVPDVRRLTALGFRPLVDLHRGLLACWAAQP